jgi:hypothetical protein
MPKISASFMASTIERGKRRPCSISSAAARILGDIAMAACRIGESVGSAWPAAYVIGETPSWLMYTPRMTTTRLVGWLRGPGGGSARELPLNVEKTDRVTPVTHSSPCRGRRRPIGCRGPAMVPVPTIAVARISAAASVIASEATQSPSVGQGDCFARNDRMDVSLFIDTEQLAGIPAGKTPELQWFDGKSEQIADSAFRQDDSRCARIGLKFAPKPGNVHVDTAIKNIAVNARRIQDLRTG